jgi:hypothetical protein
MLLRSGAALLAVSVVVWAWAAKAGSVKASKVRSLFMEELLEGFGRF